MTTGTSSKTTEAQAGNTSITLHDSRSKFFVLAKTEIHVEMKNDRGVLSMIPHTHFGHLCQGANRILC